MSSKPFVSIVVCHHTGDLIDNFIKSVRASNTKDFDYEIIVITSDPKRTFDCDLTIIDTSLPARKRNLGVEVSKGEYIAFFDDDVEIDPDCIANLLIHCRFENSFVFGKLWNMEHRNRFDEAGGYLTWTGFIWSRAEQNCLDYGQYDDVTAIFAGKSASCMITKSLFKGVGGFDEDFGILGEETDLAWRVWLYGQPVRYEPKATGYHAFNTKFKPVTKFYNSERVHWNGCRNYITMLIKNLSVKNMVLILPIHILIWFIAGGAMIFTGKFTAGWNIWRGIGYVMKNFGMILEKRKKVQLKRFKSDNQIFPYIYYNPGFNYYLQRFMRYIHIGLHG